MSRLDVMSSVAGALSGFESALNSKDAYGVMTGLSQTTAALGAAALANPATVGSVFFD